MKNYRNPGFYPYSLFAISLFAILGACVPMPEDALKNLPPAAQADVPPYKGLEPGYKTYETAHFLVKAYTTEIAVAQSVVCEQAYSRVMNDLGLYSFAPAKPYNIVVYRDADEYLKATGQPRWSGGIAYGNAILIYGSAPRDNIVPPLIRRRETGPRAPPASSRMK